MGWKDEDDGVLLRSLVLRCGLLRVVSGLLMVVVGLVWRDWCDWRPDWRSMGPYWVDFGDGLVGVDILLWVVVGGDYTPLMRLTVLSIDVNES